MIGQQALTKALVVSRMVTKVPVRTMYPQQSSNHIASMPRNRIPFHEKVAAGVLIASLILATPAWILTHMDDYRTLPTPEE